MWSVMTAVKPTTDAFCPRTGALLSRPSGAPGEDCPAPRKYNVPGERVMKVRERLGSWVGALPYGLIAAGAVLRVAPHPWNFAPIGAMALFGGAVLSGGWAFAVPLAALLLSDAVLGFYPGWIWVYGSFVLIVLIGMALRTRRTVLRVAGAALGSSVLFFIVTNFGEWLGPLYPHTLAGLRADFVAAIPFFRNTLLSDLAYSLAFFGTYESATRLARQRGRRSGPAALHRTM